ncbi:MAG: Crp/Fnr family transcriptional regulator [Thermoanaerobacterales bacterium]|nr:Crp/Fnr family transcriptional regulator [Bacillota bacterium]MDI6906365.1 Crp/Fnr family transcriptional regulator [Thermoanaerobacterales bacterium]
MTDLTLNDYERRVLREAGVRVHYPRGQIIWSAEEVADRVYLVEEGYVKVYRIDPQGRELAVETMRNPGELMGVAETLYGGKRTCFARAVTNVTLVVLTGREFLAVLNTEHRFALKVASLLGSRMREAEEQAYRLVCWQVPGRLALMLLKLARDYGIETGRGTRIGIQLTYSEIASMIGSTRQTVTSLMNTFRDEGCITVEGRAIIIKDAEKLAEWVV